MWKKGGRGGRLQGEEGWREREKQRFFLCLSLKLFKSPSDIYSSLCHSLRTKKLSIILMKEEMDRSMYVFSSEWKWLAHIKHVKKYSERESGEGKRATTEG